MDLRTAQIVHEAINQYFCKDFVSYQSVCNMKPIYKATEDSYTVLGLQNGDATVFVRLETFPDNTSSVVGIREVDW